MRQQIDFPFVANMVSMLRADIDGALLVCDDEVEARFYERCVDESGRVIAATGFALQVLGVVETRGVHGVAAAVRGPDRPEYQAANVFRPSSGDVASLLLGSVGCERVVADVGGLPWVTACEKDIGPVRGRAVWIARILAELRAKRQDCTGRSLELGGAEALVDWGTFDLAWSRVEPLAVGQGLPREALADIKASTLAPNLPDDLLKSDGMEALELLAAATSLYHPRGVRACRSVNAVELCQMVRVAYDLSEFETDSVFWKMKGWQYMNPRYPLLRNWRFLDPLGVVLDQRYWEADLSRIVEVPAFRQVSVLKMDLDEFKGVNSELGHSGGDDAIRLYCSVVKRMCEGNGEVYRRGGDEVIVIAPGLNHRESLDLAERIRGSIESEFNAWCHERTCSCRPTASIGVVTAVRGVPASELIRAVDAAQMRAKTDGKNRVVGAEVLGPQAGCNE